MKSLVRFNRTVAAMSFVCVALVVPSARVTAGTLFVSGDTNIIQPLTGANSFPISAGNQQFFQNVLQGATQVRLLNRLLPSQVNVLESYFDSLPGVNATVFSGFVSPLALAGTGLFVAVLPDNAFTPGEIAALSGYLQNGSNIMFLGDNASAPSDAGNAAINAALTALGSSMTLVPGSLDDGSVANAMGSQIANDPFTAGVTSFRYVSTSSVTGGTPLFFTTGGAGGGLTIGAPAFVAYESFGTTVVPLPASWGLFALGIAAIGALRRRAAPAV
ncbi:MAG: hypothetical protein H7125_00080 [Proteobacteria bacterium]|nr:hypothetical protein [Burkholderiales bacterium]